MADYYLKIRQILGSVSHIKSICAKYLHKRRNQRFDRDMSIDEISKTFPNLRDRYLYFHHYFWNLTPEAIRTHRTYFCEKQRGFGEDAFHSMWYILFRDLKPKLVLEIGVYRGQVISLWALLSKCFRLKVEIHGISPFTAKGDNVSRYRTDIDYCEDTLSNFSHFGLETPTLHRGLSTDPAMLMLIDSRKWDLIYVDGNHDFDVAAKDIAACSKALAPGGILVLDDASLYTAYKPFPYSSAGHPGPSKIANEMNPKEFFEVLSVGHNRVFRKLT